MINKQSSKDKSLMFFVRKLVLICQDSNIVFKTKGIAGVKNRLAHSSSRLQVQSFKLLAPTHKDKLAMEMPLHLQHQSWQPYLEHLCSLVYNHPPFELTRRMELVSPFQLFDLSRVTFKISHNCTTVFSNYCLSL